MGEGRIGGTLEICILCVHLVLLSWPSERFGTVSSIWNLPRDTGSTDEMKLVVETTAMASGKKLLKDNGAIERHHNRPLEENG